LSVSLAEAAAPPAAQAEYNPGGLVPEVPQPAPWPVFLGGLGILAALVAIPMAVPALAQRIYRPDKRAKATGAPGRIRLQEPREPRVRLK